MASAEEDEQEMWDIPSHEQVLNKQVFVPRQELQGHMMLGNVRRRTGGSRNLLFQITFPTSQCQEDSCSVGQMASQNLPLGDTLFPSTETVK